MNKKALVLGGGSLKGAWQVGAIQAVFDELSFEPDMIYGISVGALNGSFMVQKSSVFKGKIDWKQVNFNLLEFWLKEISSPEKIGVLRSKMSLGLDSVLSKFDGLLDTTPLRQKINQYIHPEDLEMAHIALKIGAVNINSGEIEYFQPGVPHFLDYLQASSSLPFIMPAVKIGGDHRHVYMDGGLREVVPIKQAILDGATEIVCVATHPENRQLEPFNYRSIFGLLERIKDISVNQFENADLAWAYKHISQHSEIKMQVIRPKVPLHLDLTKFSSEDIRELIKRGYEEAYNQIKDLPYE